MVFSEFVQRRHKSIILFVPAAILLCLLPALQFLLFNPPSLPTLTEKQTATEYDASPAAKLCIYTKTAPDATRVRLCQRNKCRPQYDNSTHLFVLGAPSYETRMVKAHEQGRLASTEEVIVSGNIIDEHDTFGDILAVPYRDFTTDESAKQLAALKHGVNQNCSYTIIVEDKFCVNVTKVRHMLAAQRPNEEVYFGYRLFNGTENSRSTRGPHGEHVRYMSGGYNGLSHKLASFIVKQDWTHSVMKVYYGSNSEDSNMGHWVDYAMKKHNVTVNYVPESEAPGATLNEICMERGDNVKYDHDLCIVTMTGADFFDARQCQRSVCRPHYGDSPHLFVVGIPSYVEKEDPSKNQNDPASDQEVEVAGKIIKENEKFGDILATSHRDFYIDLPEKRMAILKFGVENKCAYTVKVDDEFCANVTFIHQLIKVHERDHPDSDLYFGYYQFKGTEYQSMKGPHGEYVSYMSGWCNGASYRLASYIVNEDWTHTVMKAHYGSSSEDVDMGHWVDYAMKRHNLKVNFVANRNIIKEIPQGSCQKNQNKSEIV